ncbi:MAG TPA: hypothetical protein VGR03_03745 [Candidatus Acidoferrum sp.]|nr:hypothetical protein [Candidatus Acidoferrum sp.]
MNFRRLFTSSSVICMLLGVFAFYYARPITILCYAKWKARNAPEMWVVPKPLSDITLSAANGRKFSYFGYEFEVPWTEVKQERKLQSIAIVNFSNGAVVTILNPVGELGELQILQKEAAKRGRDVKAVFGEDASRSNYSLRSKILNLTPRDLRFFSSRQEMVSDSILLILKSIWTKRIKGGLYSFQTEWLHGFQEGGPAEDKMVIIEAWDANDRKMEVWIGSEPRAPKFSQAEVNRILFSLRPISPSPPQ